MGNRVWARWRKLLESKWVPTSGLACWDTHSRVTRTTHSAVTAQSNAINIVFTVYLTIPCSIIRLPRSHSRFRSSQIKSFQFNQMGSTCNDPIKAHIKCVPHTVSYEWLFGNSIRKFIDCWLCCGKCEWVCHTCQYNLIQWLFGGLTRAYINDHFRSSLFINPERVMSVEWGLVCESFIAVKLEKNAVRIKVYGGTNVCDCSHRTRKHTRIMHFNNLQRHLHIPFQLDLTSNRRHVFIKMTLFMRKRQHMRCFSDSFERQQIRQRDARTVAHCLHSKLLITS